MLREWKMNNCMKKNLSFGIGFTVDLKNWISQVDLPYACADPEGYGGAGPPGKSQILYVSIEISIWTPHPLEKFGPPSPEK